MASVVKQNYHPDCEAGINILINQKLTSSYIFLSVAHHFDRDDLALAGCHGYFKAKSDEKRTLAEKLMKYQNSRGGRIVLQDIKKPDRDEWGNALNAMQVTLDLEKSANEAYIALTHTAEKHGDEHLADFMEDEFLATAVDTIKEVADKITELKRVGTGLGEFLFDKSLK